MNPIDVLLARLPDGPGQPPAPALLSSDEFERQFREIQPPPQGLGGRLLPAVHEALGNRIAQKGEAAGGRSAYADAKLFVSPRLTDVHSGRTTERQDLNPAERTLKAAAWACAASAILHEARDEYPQAVSQILRQDGRTRVEALAADEAPGIVVVERMRAWLMPSPAGRNVAEVASELGSAMAVGKFTRLDAAKPQAFAAPIAIFLDRRSLQVGRSAHHAHGMQGPWGSMIQCSRGSNAPPMELLGGSTVAVSGEAVAELARRIYKRVDELLHALPDGTYQWLGRELTRAYIDAWRSVEHGLREQPEGRREEFVVAEMARAPHDVVELAWATGVALHTTLLAHCSGWSTVFDKAPRTLSPTLQVVLSGDLAVLTAVRFEGTEPEALEAFRARFEEQAERERNGDGLLSDALRRSVRQPTSDAARAKLFGALRKPGPLPGPLGWVDGAARIELVTLQKAPPWPQHTGATPPEAPPGSPYEGGVSVIAQVAPDGSTVGLTGTGLFSVDRSYRATLDELLRRLS